MLYLYDAAIVNDLKRSFNENSNVVVRAVSQEDIISVAAQIQNDEISLPMVALVRGEDTSIDTELANFTRIHKGVGVVFDNDSNNIYYERAIPINLSYTLAILTSNTADMDELVRELIFKYTSMYFLAIDTPYESKRRIRFGIRVDNSDTIDRISSAGDYLRSGQLYQTNIPLVCEGAVLLTYTPQHLRRVEYETTAVGPSQIEYAENQGYNINDLLT